MKKHHQSVEDGFQTLILREVLLADGLKADVDFARLGKEVGQMVASPASVVVNMVVSTKLSKMGGQVAGAMTKQAILAASQPNRSLYALRVARKTVQRIKGDAESTAHSCCRAALCYALSGEYDDVEEWLVDAEKQVGDLARPHFIRGLCAGARGNLPLASAHLKRALNGRAKPETKERIREALALAE